MVLRCEEGAGAVYGQVESGGRKHENQRRKRETEVRPSSTDVDVKTYIPPKRVKAKNKIKNAQLY